MKTRSQRSKRLTAETRRTTNTRRENPKDVKTASRQVCAAVTNKRNKFSPPSRCEGSLEDDRQKNLSNVLGSVDDDDKISSDDNFIDEEEKVFTEMEKEMEDQLQDQMQQKENQEVLMLFRDAIQNRDNNVDDESEEKDSENIPGGLNLVSRFC